MVLFLFSCPQCCNKRLATNAKISKRNSTLLSITYAFVSCCSSSYESSCKFSVSCSSPRLFDDKKVFFISSKETKRIFEIRL